jgi:alpha-N-acetylglucosamine transferase
MDPRYQRCIASIQAVYPELVIFTFPCQEAEGISDYRAKSDVTRIKIMGEFKEALYFDADVLLHKPLDLSREGPTFHSCFNDPDICVMYHRDNREFFQRLFRDFMRLPYEQPCTVQSLLRNQYFDKITLYEPKGEYEHLMLSQKPT